MFDKLGPRKYIVPFLAPILLVCLFALMFYPMANMQMKDMPFAIVNLDQGVDLPTGHVNAGDTMADKLASGEGLASDSEGQSSSTLQSDAISWTVITDADEFEAAKANNEYFGYIVIPDGFTLKQVAAQLQSATSSASNAAATASDAASASAAMASNAAAADTTASNAAAAASTATGASDADAASASAAMAAAQAQVQAMQQLAAKAAELGDVSLSVQIDKAKSPMAAMQIQTAFSTLLSTAGLDAQVSLINDGGYDTSNATAYGTMMSMQLAMLPTVMGSLMGAILLSRVFNRKNAKTKAEAAKLIGAQVALGLGVSLVLALCCWCAVAYVAGLEMPAANAIFFLWAASFCMILLFGGCFNLNVGLGVLAALCIMGLGNMTGVLPAQMLPDFWANWVCPWAPQAYVGLGVRLITYMDAGAWNAATPTMLIYGVVGIVLLGIAIAAPSVKREATANDLLSESAAR